MGLTYFIDPQELQKEIYSQNSEHYIDLFGAGLPHFQGTYVQRGQGLFGDLIRNYALPLFKKAAPHILHGVHRFIGDIKKGRPLKQSLKQRGTTAVKRAAASVLTGSGKKRKAPVKKTQGIRKVQQKKPEEKVERKPHKRKNAAPKKLEAMMYKLFT